MPFDTYSFRLISTYNESDANIEVNMVKLKGDDGYYMTRVFKEGKRHNSLIIHSRGKKPLSQINDASAELSSVTTLQNPQNGNNILFYSANNGKNLTLRSEIYTFGKPLKRESRYFEPYWRNDKLMGTSSLQWSARFIPLFLEDIDGDGRLELVASAIDGYSANPRGLIAYDFESGKQKWFVQSPACFTSVLFEDLDGDGHKEFIVGTDTYKNTSESLHGIDDYNGFVAVIDRFGQVQFTEKLLEGTSEIRVQVKDIDQDGKKDIMVLALRRSSDASNNKLFQFNYDGKRLIRVKYLELSKNQESLHSEHFLLRLERTNEYKILVKDQINGLQLYDMDFNLLQSGVMGMDYLLSTGDFLGDGRKELLFINKNEEFVLLNSKLQTIATLPYPDQGNRLIKAQLYKPSNRQKPILMIATERKTLFYEIVHISPTLYIFNLFKAYAIWLNLLLLLIIIHLFWVNHMCSKSLLQTLNTSERAFILVNSKMRIRFINKRGIALGIKLDSEHKLRNLATAFPALAEPFTQVILAGANYEETKVSLAGKDFKLSIERLSSLRKRYLILLTPLSSDTDAEMLAWADTARRLSHHVRRHITNVVLALDYLDDSATEQSYNYLNIIRMEIDKIRVFTHAFQRFSEMSSLDLKLIDIVPHVEHTLEQARLGDRIKLIKSFSTKSVHAFIEPVRFEEALLNTINNATEAMPEGGTLHVSIRVFNAHSSPKGALSVLIEVEDSGKGIPAKYMQDIWMPFFTTNQSGTGIGIPETRKIMDSMGGILDIQSEEGVGTTVSLWLKGESDG